VTLKTNKIEQVLARQVFDSRGRPTVEVDVVLNNGIIGRGCAPSGASTGRHEAVELRDHDPSVFSGLGVSKAVGNVHAEIGPALYGMAVTEQQEIDARLVALDGTVNLSRLGANATLATSIALCRAAATDSGLALHSYINRMVPERSMSMPVPMTNILSGGAHANRGMDIQDFLAIPVSAKSYKEALIMVIEVRSAASRLAERRNLPALLADEGGLSPGFPNPTSALDFMIESFKEAGYTPGKDLVIAIDIAASEFYVDGSYRLARQGKTLSGSEMVAFVRDLADTYPIVSIEDPLDQDDWDHWRTLMTQLPACQILGDDLFVTSAERIGMGIAQSAANSAIIKINQNGTLSGTIAAMRVAWSGGFSTVVSARSGETEDSFIADLAVATGAGQIKIGSTRNSDRLSKYNQLLRIEEVGNLPYAGIKVLAGTEIPATL
jgi:enolase